MCLTPSHPGDVKNVPRVTLIEFKHTHTHNEEGEEENKLQKKSKYCGRSSVVDGESSSDRWEDPLTWMCGGRRVEEGLGEGRRGDL